MATSNRHPDLATPTTHALETIERVLADALGHDLDRQPVFTPRNVTALAYEAAAKLREGRGA